MTLRPLASRYTVTAVLCSTLRCKNVCRCSFYTPVNTVFDNPCFLTSLDHVKTSGLVTRINFSVTRNCDYHSVVDILTFYDIYLFICRDYSGLRDQGEIGKCLKLWRGEKNDAQCAEVLLVCRLFHLQMRINVVSCAENLELLKIINPYAKNNLVTYIQHSTTCRNRQKYSFWQ